MTRDVAGPAPREGESAPLAGPPAGAAQDASTGVAATLAAYVPTEAVALYTTALAFLVPAHPSAQPQHYDRRWVLAIVVAVLAVLYAVGTVRREQRRARRPFVMPWSKVVVVIVAFAAWVCVIPGSPFNSFGWYSPPLGAVIGMVTQSALGAAGLFFDDP